MSGLFELDDFEETRAPEWVPVGDWARCAHCGAKGGFNQGGTGGMVCDLCASIDSCRVRENDVVIEPRHTSRWGMSHPIASHDELVAKQAQRRARYLAALVSS